MIAFLFPGQGSQTRGMGEPWVDTWPELFDLASDAADKDVRRLVCSADEDELRQTDNAQLATAVCSLAAWKALTEAGLAPAAVAGHSLGEYPALVAAGSISPSDCVRLVAARGAGMAEAADRHPGTMLALLGADAQLADEACRKAGGTVVVANINAADQVVISGTPGAVGRAGEAAKRLGAKRVMGLNVGGAFHSPLMAPALPPLAAALARTDFADPQVPVVCNVDARPHRSASGLVPALLAQLASPVLWEDSSATLAACGVRGWVEVGSGNKLAKLAKRSQRGSIVTSVAEPADAEQAAAALAGITAPSPSPLTTEDDFGEVVDMYDRLVIAPVKGRYNPAPARAYTSVGEYVSEGQFIGEVLTADGSVPVHSSFNGWIMNEVADKDDRVEAGQPLISVRPF